MKTFFKILTLGVLSFQISCQVDPQSDIEDGNWNQDRNVLSIKLKNQIGNANIQRVDDTKGTIELIVNVDESLDLSKIAIEDIVLSYGAKASVTKGSFLDFKNENYSSTLTVTSQTGKDRVYTLIVNPFRESIVGTYQINDLSLFGGTGPEYGGGAILSLTSKPWAWSSSNGPQAELDNSLTFTLDGVTDEGNTYGKVVNDAGKDELYADFKYVLNPETDVNHFYRKIPVGESTWFRDYTLGTITFTAEDGTKSVGSLKENETINVGYGMSKTITDQAFQFELKGTDDWGSIYSDFDKFVKKPRLYWVEVKKVN